MMRFVSLVGFLFGFWLLLSGHYTPFLMAVGGVCSIGVAWLAWHMHIVDHEGHPIEWLPASMLYWPWLAKEVIVSALNVSRIIINPALPISPTVLEVKGSQRTALGVNIYANSITLTPGTITIGVTRKDIVVHALTREGADELAEGVMNRRVKQFEGSK